MEFGKLVSIEGIDFTLPPDPPENERLLSRLPFFGKKPKAWIGSTGWSMKEWAGSFYPEKAKPGEFLAHYGRQFNCIEANTTFYKIPEAATIDGWLAATPDDFRFCPKVPQSISHLSNFSVFGKDLALFIDAMERLGDRLGCVFLQLSPAISPLSLGKIELFLKNWPPALPLAIEVRHEGFFPKKGSGELPPEAADYFQLIENHGVATCLSDVAGRRDVCWPKLTAGRILVRFVTTGGQHPTDFERAESWARRAAEWFGKGLPEIYFFAHAPDNVRSPEVAMILEEKLRAAVPGIDTRGPRPLARTAVQGSLF